VKIIFVEMYKLIGTSNWECIKKRFILALWQICNKLYDINDENANRGAGFRPTPVFVARRCHFRRAAREIQAWTMKGRAYHMLKRLTCLCTLSCSALIAAQGEDVLNLAGNETVAAASCKAFAEAEEIFHRTDYGNFGCLRYSQTLCGGKHKFIPLKASEPVAFQKPTGEERQKIEALITEMGSDEYAVREKASTAVAEFGSKALPQLEEAAKKYSDPEILQRCNKIRQDIDKKLAPPSTLTDLEGLCGTANAEGECNYDLGLVDKTFAQAECPLGADPSKITPKAGYLFRVLTGQSVAAVGGKKSYIVGKFMTLGYALLAFPKEYGRTGKKCFIINNNGVIYERDFGDKEKTEAYVKDCQEFNPTKEWIPAD